MIDRNRIANIPADDGTASPDNLGIALCSYFADHVCRPLDDTIDERTGWSAWAVERTNAVLDKIVQVVNEQC